MGRWQADGMVLFPLQRVTRELDQSYGTMGSLFRCGFQHTLFSSQLVRYADLYTASCLNFLHYSLSSLYRAAPELVGPTEAPSPDRLPKSICPIKAQRVRALRLTLFTPKTLGESPLELVRPLEGLGPAFRKPHNLLCMVGRDKSVPRENLSTRSGCAGGPG